MEFIAIFALGLVIGCSLALQIVEAQDRRFGLREDD